MGWAEAYKGGKRGWETDMGARESAAWGGVALCHHRVCHRNPKWLHPRLLEMYSQVLPCELVARLDIILLPVRPEKSVFEDCY